MATKENEEFWAPKGPLGAEKVQQLPNRALETFVQDFKIENGLNKPKSKVKSLHVQNLQLDEDVEEELLELQRKGIDVNQLLREFLEQRKLEIVQEKEKLAEASVPTSSRYIPVKIRRHLWKQHGSKCSINHGPKPATTIHHTQRFALAGTHNPHYLAPLCREHHAITHAIDNKVQAKRGVG